MTYNDLMGTIGVGLILFAYFLNTSRLLNSDSKMFYLLNIIGSLLACYASYLISYLPFIILEGTWALVSIYGLMKIMKIKMT